MSADRILEEIARITGEIMARSLEARLLTGSGQRGIEYASEDIRDREESRAQMLRPEEHTARYGEVMRATENMAHRISMPRPVTPSGPNAPLRQRPVVVQAPGLYEGNTLAVEGVPVTPKVRRRRISFDV